MPISTQFTGVSSPNLMVSPSVQGLGLGSGDYDFSAHFNQTNKPKQARVFNYESTLPERISSVSGNQVVTFDPEPQYSLHSPFRVGDVKKDLQQKQYTKDNADSAVRGMKLLNQGVKEQIESSESFSRENQNPFIVNINAQSHQVLPLTLLSQSQQLYPLRRDESKENHKTSRLVNRKGSTDSRQSRKNSKGRTEQQSRGVSPSESQSITRNKKLQEQSKQQSIQNSVQRTLKRPNSAKNLKQTPNMNSNVNLRTMIASPTLTVLQREPSQQCLPPKPKPLRNQMFGKATEFLYQSVGSHPLSIQPSVTQSQNKRGGQTGSLERPRTAKVERKQLDDDDHHQAFSPLRRKTVQQQQQKQPNSGQKVLSNNKSRTQKKKMQTSQQRSKSKKHGTETAQPLSPNIERIRPQNLPDHNNNNNQDQDAKQFDSFERLRQCEIRVPQQQSFDESAIRDAKGIEQQESQDSSLSFQISNKQSQKTKTIQLQENYADIYKSIKLQLQGINLNEDERKKRKINEKKEKTMKDQDKTRKVNLEQLKQQMQKKIEGASKNLTLKRKPAASIKNLLSEQDLLKQKKQETREQWQKEREERHQCIEMVKDALKHIQPVAVVPGQKKREQSKSQQRPFSAKPVTGQEYQQNQLLVKVPPVTSEHAYDVVLTQSQQRSEVSPLRDHKFEHNMYSSDNNPQITDFMKKQKRDRSKRQKIEHEKEKDKVFKKELALIQLKETQKKQFENFKMHIIAQTKGKVNKSSKHKLKITQGEYYQSAHTQKESRQPHRSKSKKKLDDEKENRRVSLSPKQSQHVLRSGGRSKSDKRKNSRKNVHGILTNVASEAQLFNLTKKLQKAGVFDFINNKEMGQDNNVFQIKQVDSILRKSNTLTGVRQVEAQQDYQQQYELTPVMTITKKKENQMIPESLASQMFFQQNPSQSMKSFNLGTSINTMTPMRDSNINPLSEQLPRQNINLKSHQNFQSSQLQLAQQSEMQRSRSGSKDDVIQKSQKKKKKKSQRVLSDQYQHPKIESPEKLEVAKHLVIPKQQVVRKGSAGYKRNQPIITQQQNQQIASNSEKHSEKHSERKDPQQRPRSANVQKINLIDLIQQQQKQLKEQQQYQRELAAFNAQQTAALSIQKVFRGKQARIVYSEMRNQQQVEKDLKLIQEKYWKAKPKETVNDSPLKSLIQKDMNTNASEIKIVNEDSFKLSGKKEDYKQDKDNSSYVEDASKLSRSQANLKQLIITEKEKDQKQKQRPRTSGQKSSKILDMMDQQSHQSSSKFDTEIINVHRKVSERIEFQTALNQKHEEQVKHIKGLINVDSISSSHNEESKQNQKQVYSIITPYTSNRGGQDFESVTSEIIEEKKNTMAYEAPLRNSGSRNMIKGKDERSLTVEDQKLHRNSLNPNVEPHSQILALSSFNGQSQDDQNHNWQFERRSFQEFFEQNSQIMKEERKKIAVKASDEESSSEKHQEKTSFQRKLNQYEEMLQQLAKKNNRDKQELKKLHSKRHLSPTSQKKMVQLEKWVSKQEEQLIKKREWYSENVNEMISKIDKDLQITKQKIGPGKKSSQMINTSVDWSHDMSIGHLTQNSSIHSTPRITKPPSNISNVLQQQQSVTERTQKKQAFEYKIPTKTESSQLLEESKEVSVIKISRPVAVTNDILNLDQIELEPKNKDTLQESDKELAKSLSTLFQKSEQNVFNQNLLQSQSNPIQSDRSSSQFEDANERSKIIVEEEDTERQDDEESLSRMEPPNFQSPTLSAISPYQKQKEFINYEDERQGLALMQILDGHQESMMSKNLHISPLSPQNQSETSMMKNDQEPPMPQVSIQFDLKSQVVDSQQKEAQDLVDAFLALKEPEQPITFSEAQEIRDQRQMIDEHADMLTDFILMHLVEQIKQNMFPKRPMMPLKTPIQEELSQDLQNFPQASIFNHDNNNEHEVVEEKIDEIQTQDEQQMIFEDKESIDELKKKKIRGIRTSMKVVDTYVTEVFKKVKDNEDEFVENLSTPLNKDPLEILLHLQNVYVDSDMEAAVAFQQSVLPVDLYLEQERNKNQVLAEDSFNEEEPENKSMLAEWENIHNKVIFDGINEALDNFRPYGLRGPPMPWSQQTRTLTYKNGQQLDMVLKQVKQKVVEWARTFAGALPCSELLKEYGIRGPLDEDKLNLLREERLALVLAAEIEENEMLWTDYEYEETQTKLDVADMILEFLAEEAVQSLNKIKEQRMEQSSDTTVSTIQQNQ